MARLDLVDQVAVEVLSSLDRGRQIEPVSARQPQFDLETAYAVTARIAALRTARGEKQIGRKLGFTNRNIWDEYGVYAPIWGYTYATTVHAADPAGHTVKLVPALEPRIEPEITLSLKRAPEPGMDEAALLDCLDWVAHGFEIVQSVFPDWKFKAPDTVAAFGLHGSLHLGPKHALASANRSEWLQRLTTFEVELYKGAEKIDQGHARNVLGGPLSALKNVVEVLADDPHNPALAAGEFITTGTITRAFPVSPGQAWSSRFKGAPFDGLTLHFE